MRDAIYLHLYNGSKTREAWNPDSPEFIDDWKPEARTLGPFTDVQVTYGDHVKAYTENGDGDLSLSWCDGWIELDGVYYGDVNVNARQ